LKQREIIGPFLKRIEGLQIRKGTKKVHLLDFVRRNGLWIKSLGSEIFYYGFDLVDIFLNILSSRSAEIVLEVYSKIEYVKVNVTTHLPQALYVVKKNVCSTINW
jgi:hypothetical protein